MTQTVTVIPGDGIGPEVTEATLKILKAAGADFEYDMQLAGMSALESVKSPLPDATVVPGGRYDDIDLVLIRENTEGLYGTGSTSWSWRTCLAISSAT